MNLDRRLWMVFLGSGLAWACSDDEGTTACTEDFDCSVVEVCDSASSTCVEAAPGALRTFGSVTLDFSDGSEGYLLQVVSLPDGEAASSDLLAYTLNVGGGAGALRVGTRRTHSGASTAQTRWAERRYQDGLRVARQLRERPNSARALSSGATCSADCGAQAFCLAGSCVSTGSFTFVDGSAVNVDLIEVISVVGTAFNVLLDQSASSSAQAVQQAAADFAGTFERQLELFGLSSHSGPVDCNQDNRLNLVFTNQVAPGVGLDVVGFFTPSDFALATEPGASGNEADILWARVPDPTEDISEALIVGTLAHEYTHLVSFGTRVQAVPENPRPEVLWLDEALAHTVEDLTGWGPSNVGPIAVALSEWPDTPFAGPNDTVAQRGAGYSLIRYFIDNSARGMGAQNAGDAITASAADTTVQMLLQDAEIGFNHPLFSETTSSEYGAWLTALFVGQDDSYFADALGAPYLAPGTAVTGNVIGLDSRGALVDARGEDVFLDGPLTEELASVDEPFDGFIVASASQLIEVRDGTGSVTLSGVADAGVRLYLSAVRIE